MERGWGAFHVCGQLTPLHPSVSFRPERSEVEKSPYGWAPHPIAIDLCRGQISPLRPGSARPSVEMTNRRCSRKSTYKHELPRRNCARSDFGAVPAGVRSAHRFDRRRYFVWRSERMKRTTSRRETMPTILPSRRMGTRRKLCFMKQSAMSTRLSSSPKVTISSVI